VRGCAQAFGNWEIHGDRIERALALVIDLCREPPSD
jgi:hypothetical protein